MRDLLIRYLLGELDEEAQLRLEERLRQSPELARELEYLRACFSAASESGSGPAGEPPRDLARRTTAQVNGLGDEPIDDVAALLPARASVDPPSGSISWSLADLSVAAGVFLAVSMLLLPALRGSRDMARREGCANNQRELGYLFARYAAEHGGEFPTVGPNDRAGIFAAHLVDQEYIEAEELLQLLVCRDSKQGDARAAGTLYMIIPTVAQLRSAQGARLKRLVEQMVYSYGYRLGYVENNKYHCLKKRRPACDPLLADAPMIVDGESRSANHDGDGSNVLHADGNVKWIRGISIAGDPDLYRNHDKKQAAGRGRNDVVVGASNATPSVQVAEAE
jgi:hypothetical protein